MKHLAKILVVFVSVFFVFAAGCIKLHEDLTFRLNPDGSGKIEVEAVYGVSAMGGESEPDMNASLLKVLEGSKGIEGWKDPKCILEDEESIKFTGTAYFKDFSKVKFKFGDSDSSFSYTLEKEKSGNMVLTLVLGDQEEEATEEKEKLSDEEITRQAKKTKTKFEREMKPALAAILPQMSHKAGFHISGTVVESTNFTKEKDGSLSIKIDGNKLYDAIVKLAKDDKWWEEQIRSGKNIAKDGPDPLAIYKELFGTRAAPRIVFKPGEKAAFDYAAEAAVAKKETAALKKKFGVVEVEEGDVGDGTSMTMKVAGVRLNRVKNEKLYMREEYALTMLGKLPAAALKIDKILLEKATTDTGSSMLPKQKWDREIRSPQTAEDKRTFKFEIRLGLPAADVKGFAEISGIVEYLQAGQSSEVDLGITSYTKGAKGTKYSAKIKDMKESQWQKGSMEVTLEMRINKDTIKSVRFLDADGNEIEAKPSGHMSFNNQTELMFVVKGKLPAKGKIVLDVYGKMTKFKLPFSIKNIDLMGNPVK